MIEPSQISWAINTSVTETRPYGATPADIRKSIKQACEELDRVTAPSRPVICLTSEQLYAYRNITYHPVNVIFNPPATIVMWNDNTKTVVKCMEGEEFNPEVGLAMCFCKKVMGDRYKRWFKDGLKEGGWEDV